MATVAQRVSLSVPVIRNGYLYRTDSDFPIPLGTASFDHWFRQFHKCRVIIPDGSGRWVGVKRDKGLIVLQKRVNKRLYQASCGGSYSLRFQSPDYLESRALELSQRITNAVGPCWGNHFQIQAKSQEKKTKKTPKIFKGSYSTRDKRDKRDYERLMKEGELEYLILSCGQGYLFTAEAFYEFFEGVYSLDQIKAAIRRQRGVGNILRRKDGYFVVT